MELFHGSPVTSTRYSGLKGRPVPATGGTIIPDGRRTCPSCSKNPCGIVREVTKNTLIDHVAEVTQGTKKDAERVIEAILTSITAALLKNEKVDLRGFGSFQVSDKKERQGRNPQTGATITIAARSVAVFKPSKELAVRLNEAGLRSQPD